MNHEESADAVNRIMAAVGLNAGASIWGVAVNSMWPSVLALVGTTVFTIGQVVKSCIDRDRRHLRKQLHAMKSERDELRARLSEGGRT